MSQLINVPELFFLANLGLLIKTKLGCYLSDNCQESDGGSEGAQTYNWNMAKGAILLQVDVFHYNNRHLRSRHPSLLSLDYV